ncbi:hypothetical protein CEXT_317101 [Caerostris extrusa]|uniref:Uncharacterized protein n=1 Tax=Caerostris extrusa TaxID=172846 RepID=A0AAV4TBF1_CAEEX|nr:hypothetical protein CEXT_317101 [Caerostris extrusa]
MATCCREQVSLDRCICDDSQSSRLMELSLQIGFVNFFPRTGYSKFPRIFLQTPIHQHNSKQLLKGTASPRRCTLKPPTLFNNSVAPRDSFPVITHCPFEDVCSRTF